MLGKILIFLGNNWSDILLVLVGFSAFVIYFMQKSAEKRAAATLILGQVDSIEKIVSSLRDAPFLDNVRVYNMKSILKENMWEKYKHLFVRLLSTSEYELVQTYFGRAEQLERTRENIVKTIYSAWADKSSVEHEVIGHLLFDSLQANQEDIGETIRQFQQVFRPLDIVFTPDVAINMLVKNINCFCSLSGTTAYQKLQRKSYIK